MKILIISLLWLFNLNANIVLHDDVTAKFHIINRGEVLFLEIEFDTETFSRFKNTDDLKITKEVFGKYLNETTCWIFNGKILEPKVLDIQKSKHQTKVICYLSKSLKNVKSVQIKNEFLLDINGHINIVKLDLNQTYKSYQLDKNRKEIKVSY